MKHTTHSISATIDVSPEAAWEIIGAATGVNNWLAPITACRVEGNKRYCSTEQGEFSEDILKIDHENQVFKYAIPSQHMVPVEGIVGEMQVSAAANGQAIVQWTWEFDVDPDKETEARETFTMVGNMGIQGIEAYIKNGQAQVA